MRSKNQAYEIDPPVAMASNMSSRSGTGEKPRDSLRVIKSERVHPGREGLRDFSGAGSVLDHVRDRGTPAPGCVGSAGIHERGPYLPRRLEALHDRE